MRARIFWKYSKVEGRHCWLGWGIFKSKSSWRHERRIDRTLCKIGSRLINSDLNSRLHLRHLQVKLSWYCLSEIVLIKLFSLTQRHSHNVQRPRELRIFSRRWWPKGKFKHQSHIWQIQNFNVKHFYWLFCKVKKRRFDDIVWFGSV